MERKEKDLEAVALNRLDKFINSLDHKLEKLEAMLPSSSSASGLPTPSLNRLKQRGKKFVRWGMNQVRDAPPPVQPEKQGAPHQQEEEVTTLYKFLKSTTEEFNGKETTPLESDTATLVGSNSSISLIRFSKIWHDHFNSGGNSNNGTVIHNSSSASFHSSSSTLITTSPERPNSPPSSRKSSSSVATEDVLQSLDYLDEKLETLIQDPGSIGQTIQLFNYDFAFKTGLSRHLHYYELPFPWRENRFIIHGYRFYHSHTKSLLSILNWYGWHNETTNIWTHLFGSLYIAYLAFYEFPQSSVYLSGNVPQFAKYMVYLFLGAGFKCLISSVTWHTFNGTCKLHLRSKFACMDYTGITVLITASIMTAEFVSLYGNGDDPDSPVTFSLIFYMAVSSVLCCFGVFMNWSPRFDRPESRPLRIAFYLLLAGMGFLAFLHLSLITNFAHSSWLIRPVLDKSVCWYLIGVIFYGSFIPERWRSDILVDERIPTHEELSKNLEIITTHKHIHFRENPTKHNHSVHKKSFRSLWWVDYYCCSHTLWHLFVLLGVVGHYRAVLDMFEKKWLLS